jgi:hypothetical protein
MEVETLLGETPKEIPNLVTRATTTSFGMEAIVNLEGILVPKYIISIFWQKRSPCPIH